MTDKTMTLEQAAEYGWKHASWDLENVLMGVRERHLSQPAERVRVPDGWIDRHQIAASDCPPQSMVVLVSLIRRMLSAAPEATPSPTIDVAAVKEVIAYLQSGHRFDTEQANKLARAIGDAK
jgi:hypothetical protein